MLNNNNSKIDIAILSAMPEELEYFYHLFSNLEYSLITHHGMEFKIYIYHKKKILLVNTGFGTTFAASILTLVHHHFHPDYVFLTGTAGAINQDLQLRDVIIVENAFEAEVQEAFILLKNTPFESCLTHPLTKSEIPGVYFADLELLKIASNLISENNRIYQGHVTTSNAFPAPVELFEKIKSLNPYCIDMETSAFYQVAWLLGIPALAIRGISNLLQSDGKDENILTSDVEGSSKAAAHVLLQTIDNLILELDNRIETVNADLTKEAQHIIDTFNLQPHPEGGYYSRIFQSSLEIISVEKQRFNDEKRSATTAIYYLLNKNDFSAWHRIKSDEIWHYCKGSPIKIYILDYSGNLKIYLLGDPFTHEGAKFHIAIPPDCWFAAELLDKKSYSLANCTVSPGFEFKDFELAGRDNLLELFPQHEEIIHKLTRESQIIA